MSADNTFEDTVILENDGEKYKYVATRESHAGADKRAYKAKLINPRKCDVVIKTKERGRCERKSGWDIDMKTLQKAEELAVRYNETKKPSRPVHFRQPIVMKLVSVSSSKNPLSKKIGEYVLVEAYLEGEWEKFNDNGGGVNEKYETSLQAFSHYTYDETNGELLVCDLQGVKDKDGYSLTDAAIHSRTGEYGPADWGESGMQDFFETHKCRCYCRHLGLQKGAASEPECQPAEFEVQGMTCLNKNELNTKILHGCEYRNEKPRRHNSISEPTVFNKKSSEKSTDEESTDEESTDEESTDEESTDKDFPMGVSPPNGSNTTPPEPPAAPSMLERVLGYLNPWSYLTTSTPKNVADIESTSTTQTLKSTPELSFQSSEPLSTTSTPSSLESAFHGLSTESATLTKPTPATQMHSHYESHPRTGNSSAFELDSSGLLFDHQSTTSSLASGLNLGSSTSSGLFSGSNTGFGSSNSSRSLFDHQSTTSSLASDLNFGTSSSSGLFSGSNTGFGFSNSSGSLFGHQSTTSPFDSGLNFGISSSSGLFSGSNTGFGFSNSSGSLLDFSQRQFPFRFD